MAFLKANFASAGAQSMRGKAPQHFTYDSGADNTATVKASGYFDEVANMLNAKDRIDVSASDGEHIIIVAAITAGVVTIETADFTAA